MGLERDESLEQDRIWTFGFGADRPQSRFYQVQEGNKRFFRCTPTARQAAEIFYGDSQLSGGSGHHKFVKSSIIGKVNSVPTQALGPGGI